MGAFDFQFGAIDEVTFGTPLTVTRFFEYNGDAVPFAPVAGRTEGNPLRVGSRARRQARVVPYMKNVEGTVPLDIMSKDFGFWLKHLLPHVATTGAGPYTHTATEGTSSESVGKSFTAQVNMPFHPAGTNQSLTISGGKVPKWKLSSAVDEMVTCELDIWAASMTTATALATASYTASPANFAWVHGVVTIGGSSVDLISFDVEVDQGYNLDRRQIRGNAAAKEPTPGPLEVTWSAEADFDALTQWNRVHSTTVSSLSAQIVATFTNGTDVLTVTIPGARFDELSFGGDLGGLTQSLGGVAEYDGTNSPITLAYTCSQATP
jgi:hypothetical protein